MGLAWELMTSDERRRAVSVADRKYALLMQGVPHKELDKWLAMMDEPDDIDEMLRPADVAKLLGLASVPSVTKLCRKHGLPRTIIRGTSRFDLDEVVSWAKRRGRRVNLAALRGASTT